MKNKTLAEVKIQRGIFKGYSLSSLLYVIEISLKYIISKYTMGYEYSKLEKTKIIPLMCIDDIKLSAKKEWEWETLIQTIRSYSQSIRMEDSIEKYVMIIMKSTKRESIEQMELPNQESIKMCREKKY